MMIDDTVRKEDAAGVRLLEHSTQRCAKQKT